MSFKIFHSILADATGSHRLDDRTTVSGSARSGGDPSSSAPTPMGASAEGGPCPSLMSASAEGGPCLTTMSVSGQSPMSGNAERSGDDEYMADGLGSKNESDGHSAVFLPCHWHLHSRIENIVSNLLQS